MAVSTDFERDAQHLRRRGCAKDSDAIGFIRRTQVNVSKNKGLVCHIRDLGCNKRGLGYNKRDLGCDKRGLGCNNLELGCNKRGLGCSNLDLEYDSLNL